MNLTATLDSKFVKNIRCFQVQWFLQLVSRRKGKRTNELLVYSWSRIPIPSGHDDCYLIAADEEDFYGRVDISPCNTISTDSSSTFFIYCSTDTCTSAYPCRLRSDMPPLSAKKDLDTSGYTSYADQLAFHHLMNKFSDNTQRYIFRLTEP